MRGFLNKWKSFKLYLAYTLWIPANTSTADENPAVQYIDL